MPTPDHIDILVDLRKFWPKVQDQAARPTCLACATSDAHMHSHSLTHSLSVEFLFYHSTQLMPGKNGSGGLTFDAIHNALKTEGQPSEKECPYETTQPIRWNPPSVSRKWHGLLENKSQTRITDLLTLLENPQPAVLAIRLTSEFINLQHAPFVVPAMGSGFGAHAVLAIGLGKNAKGEKLILIRNSWGPDWADGGHAWLPIQYLEDKMINHWTVTKL